MSKIEVRNTAVLINNYEMGDSPRLENYFKIYDPLTHTNYFVGVYYDSANSILYLPRGIDIWLLEDIFGERADVLVNKYTKYKKFDDFLIKYTPRDDEQKEALRFMLGKNEYRSTNKNSQLSVNLSTGKGKTYVTIATIAYKMARSIVITSSISWLDQWRERTTEYTNIENGDIYNIQGSGNVFRLLDMTKEQLSNYKLFLVTHDTLHSFGSNYGWDKITELFEHLEIGIKIYDEAHLNFNNMCMIDFYTNVYKTYYLTATPGKSNAAENRIYQLAFKNVPAISLFNEEEDPHTDYVAIMYDSNPTARQISKCRNQYGMDRNRYTNYVVKQENFFKILTICLELGLKATRTIGDKFLIYIGTNSAIIDTFNWISDQFPMLSNEIGIFTSIATAEEKSIAISKRIILSTTKSAGAAVDIPGLKMTIVLAEPFKSEIIAKQSLGRTRADNTKYIEIVDKGFEYCRKWYYAKQSVFKKYAKSSSVIRLSEEDLDASACKAYDNISVYSKPSPVLQKIMVPLKEGEKPLMPLLFRF